MYNNIIFVGGIHGVGKSTLCKHICKKFNIEYLSASTLLKWNDIKTNSNEKTVEDINYTQNRLISGLKDSIDLKKRYILDGHFCLLNSSSEISRVPFETFLYINPNLICTIVGDPLNIAHKLNVRDNQKYSFDTLNSMQLEEKSYGQSIAKLLDVEYLEITIAESNIFENTILKLRLNESPA